MDSQITYSKKLNFVSILTRSTTVAVFSVLEYSNFGKLHILYLGQIVISLYHYAFSCSNDCRNSSIESINRRTLQRAVHTDTKEKREEKWNSHLGSEETCDLEKETKLWNILSHSLPPGQLYGPLPTHYKMEMSS